MAQERDDLWKGGPWEQPNRVIELPPEVKIPVKKKPRRRPTRGKVFLFVTMLCSIGALICMLAMLNRSRELFRPNNGDTRPGDTQPETVQQRTLPQAETGTGVTVELAELPEQGLTFSQSYEKNRDSIVTVHVADKYGMSQGTGIVLTRDGYIITNAHVVEGAFMAQVVLSNDITYEAALVGCSMEEDLAVLKISAEDLTPAEFGDSDLLKVGDDVSVLGSPLGYRMTLTSGIVSAVDRELEIDGVSMYLLQTDAAINFGNSGGALFNDRGQVVGVTTAKIMSSDGSTEALGFAIPTRRVKYVVDQLIAGEEIRTPAMGITVQFDPAVEGLTVLEIQDWSDGVEQGLRVGDVIHAVAGQQVRTTRDLERIKNLHKVGERLILDVERDGEEMVFAVLLKDWEQLYGDAG